MLHEIPPNLPNLILAIVGGDPKSEFRADQFAPDIAGAKPGMPPFWAKIKKARSIGNSRGSGNDGGGTPFPRWAGTQQSLENDMGNQNDQSGQKNQQQKHQNQPQSGQQSGQQQRQGGQQGQPLQGQLDRDQQSSRSGDQQNKQR